MTPSLAARVRKVGSLDNEGRYVWSDERTHAKFSVLLDGDRIERFTYVLSFYEYVTFERVDDTYIAFVFMDDGLHDMSTQETLRYYSGDKRLSLEIKYHDDDYGIPIEKHTFSSSDAPEGYEIVRKYVDILSAEDALFSLLRF